MNNEYFYIYKITNLANGKIYIGQTSDMKRRMKAHFNHYKNSIISSAIQKYGKENFKIDIIESTFCSKDDGVKWANEREKFIIKDLKNNGYILYNIAEGGNGSKGFTHSLETRKKRSTGPIYKYDRFTGEFIEEFISLSESARSVGGIKNPIKRVLIGKAHYAYNYYWSYIKKDIIEIKQPPKPVISDNCRLASKNSKNRLKGVLHPKSREVNQYDLDGNFIQSFINAREASKVLNISNGKISSCANLKVYTAGGFQWRFFKKDKIEAIDNKNVIVHIKARG